MELTGLSVLVMDQNLEGAIRFFKKKCEASRLPQDIKRHEYYLTRSQRRKVKDQKALIRLRKRRREYGS